MFISLSHWPREVERAAQQLLAKHVLGHIQDHRVLLYPVMIPWGGLVERHHFFGPFVGRAHHADPEKTVLISMTISRALP